MSVKHALLSLLDQGPRYGYQLRGEFEERTGSQWPLNIGQVYTTLQRLERDGLVLGTGADEEGRPLYETTEAGAGAVARWFTTPVERAQPPRDELAIKLALAITVPGVDTRAVIQVQRTATMAALQDLVLARRALTDLAEALVLESLIFAAEAELRWLDHCEQRLATQTKETA